MGSEWDSRSDIEDNERKLFGRLRERLAPFVKPEELDDAIRAAFPGIADLADRHSWIEERQRTRGKRARRDRGTDCYATD